MRLDEQLARVRGDGVTFIALPAVAVPAAAIVAAWPDAPAVAWSAGNLAIAGIGVAREVRGTGAARWRELVEAARAVEIAGALVDGERVPVATLGEARPRWLGGAAFAPGAASSGPWAGFGDAWFVLPRWTYVLAGDVASLVLAVTADDARDVDRWLAELAVFAQIGERGGEHWRTKLVGAALVTRRHVEPPAQARVVDVAYASPELWRAQVEAITSAIAAGECSKIVAARTCTVTLANLAGSLLGRSYGPGELLAALDARHTECVRALVRPPGAGALVAATPERLVRRTGELVQCDALAGTIRAGEASALLASAKDRREHDLVVRAIALALASTGAEVDVPAEPVVRELRHVLHLHTPFRARLREPRHLLELAELLHPTPAMGGTPTAFAIDWIAVHEPVPRGWYASPIGWFDLDGNGELAVAIRSGVLVGNRAHLWAGAGIVSGSDPDRELAETELKLRAMLGALGATEPGARQLAFAEAR